jgi:integrase
MTFTQNYKQSHFNDLTLIAFYSGMRLGEVQKLLLSNIDLELDMIVLQEQQTKGESGRFILYSSCYQTDFRG